MELYTALRNIISVNGQDIIKDVRVINILNDYNTFQNNAGIQYMLRAFIEDGYINQLLSVGKLDNSISILSNKIATKTGFTISMIDYIIYSIVYGLGWSNEKPSNQFNQQTNTQNKQSSQIPNSFKRKTKKEQELFLEDLIYIEPYLESKYGLIVKANTSISYSTLYINIEVSGRLEQEDLSIFIAIYDKKGEFKDYKRIFRFDMRPSSSPFCHSRIFFDGFLTTQGDKPIDYDISKIIIYAQC